MTDYHLVDMTNVAHVNFGRMRHDYTIWTLISVVVLNSQLKKQHSGPRR